MAGRVARWRRHGDPFVRLAFPGLPVWLTHVGRMLERPSGWTRLVHPASFHIQLLGSPSRAYHPSWLPSYRVTGRSPPGRGEVIDFFYRSVWSGWLGVLWKARDTEQREPRRLAHCDRVGSLHHAGVGGAGGRIMQFPPSVSHPIWLRPAGSAPSHPYCCLPHDNNCFFSPARCPLAPGAVGIDARTPGLRATLPCASRPRGDHARVGRLQKVGRKGEGGQLPFFSVEQRAR